MNFYYITEDNKPPLLLSGTNKEIFDNALELAKKETSRLGFLAAKNDKRIKATLCYNYFAKNVHTQLRFFIRKYAALGTFDENN